MPFGKMRWIAIYLALSAVAGHSQAATSQWANSQGGRMRLVTVPPKADGTLNAVLEIEPLPGWKTYWRDPGASGLAPELDFGTSSNLVFERMDFPVPSAIGSGQAGFIGYDDRVGLSLAFRQPRPGEKSTLEAKVLVGLCDQICIPFSAKFTLAVGYGDNIEADELRAVRRANAALAQRPGDDFHVASAELSVDGKTIEVGLKLPQNSSPEIFIAPPRGVVIGRPLNGAFTQDRFTFQLPVKRIPKDQSLRLEKIMMLVKAGNRAMETTLVPQ